MRESGNEEVQEHTRTDFTVDRTWDSTQCRMSQHLYGERHRGHGAATVRACERDWVTLARGMLAAPQTIGVCDGPRSGVDGFIHAVIDILRARTGVDFSCYRAPMLERRISNRVASAGTSSIEEYLRLLGSCAAEPFRLLERITIKVSRFYRYAPTFDLIGDQVLPALARARGGEPLRIWSAGCGAGEEPYTFAMLMDRLGIEGSVEATDIDVSALHDAVAGLYPVSAAAELPTALAAEYLEPVVVRGQPHYRVREDLRARVRFARHDITSTDAAPGNERFDLVSCRNVLIYLQRPSQASAMQRLLDMIRENGVLCLGEAEWPLPEVAEALEALAHKARLFRLRTPPPFIEDHELNRARLRRPGA